MLNGCNEPCSTHEKPTKKRKKKKNVEKTVKIKIIISVINQPVLYTHTMMNTIWIKIQINCCPCWYWNVILINVLNWTIEADIKLQIIIVGKSKQNRRDKNGGKTDAEIVMSIAIGMANAIAFHDAVCEF